MKVMIGHRSPLLRVLLAFVSFSCFLGYTNAVGQPTSQSNVRSVVGNLRLHQLKSKVFGNTRMIRVLLPPGYSERANRNRRYPVLYLNDGQNLFDVSTSVFNPLEWQVDEALDRLIKAQEIGPLIVVGIDNAGRAERANEYLPYPDAYLRPPLASPEGSTYPDFLIREVMPLISRQYRTKSGAEHTGLGGSSYGALIALYTVIANPNSFGRLLLESPSLYVSDAQIIKRSQSIRDWPLRVYLGVGTNEDGRPDCRPGDWNQEAVQDVLKLKHTLEASGLGAARLKVVIDECALHNEAAWAKRLPKALKFLYGPPYNNGMPRRSNGPDVRR